MEPPSYGNACQTTDAVQSKVLVIEREKIDQSQFPYKPRICSDFFPIQKGIDATTTSNIEFDVKSIPGYKSRGIKVRLGDFSQCGPVSL